MNGATPAGFLAVEPVCRGHEHARVNAALLVCAALAFPGRRIRFMAEPSHLASVAKHLEQAGRGDITLSPILPPAPNKDSLISKFKAAWFCLRILGEARRAGETFVLFTAVNTAMLFFLNAWTALCHRSTRVAGVAHSVLHNLTIQPATLTGRIMGLKHTLSAAGAGRCPVIVPGESVRRNALALAPRASARLHALDLMYLFAPPPPPPPDPPPLRFGFIGVGTRRKGIDAFHRLAAQIHTLAAERTTEFVLIGRLEHPPADPALAPHVLTPVRDRFMEECERISWFSRIHYSVFPYQAEQYRLVASAAFLDAVEWGLPILAIRNDYLEEQFARLGDIGHLCQNEEELLATMLRLVRHPDPARHRAQREALLAGRRFFRPETLAPLLRDIYSDKTSPP